MSNVVPALSIPLKGSATNRDMKDKSLDHYDGYVFVYVSEKYRFLVERILKNHKLPYLVNCYDDNQWEGKTACFFKRSELDEQQSNHLVNVLAQGGQVVSLLNYLEEKLNYVEVELLHSEYLLEVSTQQASFVSRYAKLKRGLDFVLAAFLLVFSSPLWLIAALAIRLESKGDIFFRQKRTGLFNREFEIIKFRSMVIDAERSGAQWAQKNDARITKVGRFIRMTRIDELPQLINVIKGDMALIGPRPEREVFINKLERHIPFYRFRHTIRPGITGLAQVSYTYGASVEDAMTKHRYDMFYIKKQSFWVDMKILWNTLKVVLKAEGI